MNPTLLLLIVVFGGTTLWFYLLLDDNSRTPPVAPEPHTVILDMSRSTTSESVAGSGTTTSYMPDTSPSP